MLQKWEDFEDGIKWDSEDKKYNINNSFFFITGLQLLLPKDALPNSDISQLCVTLYAKLKAFLLLYLTIYDISYLLLSIPLVNVS